MGIQDELFSEESPTVVRINAAANADLQPDRARRVLEMQMQTGLPDDLISRNLERVETEASREDFDADAFRKESPIFADWIAENPNHWAAVQDDIDSMGMIEKQLSRLQTYGRAVPAGVVSFVTGTHGVLEAASTNLLAAPGQKLAELGVLPANPFADVAGYFRAQREYGEALQERIAGETPAFMGTTEQAAVSGVKSAGMNTMALGAGIATRSPQLALGLMSGAAGGLKYGEAINAGHPPSTALVAAIGEAGFEYLTEKLPVDVLFGDLAKNESFRKILLRQLAVEIPQEQAATVLQDFNDWMVLNPQKTAQEFLVERPDAAYQTLIATIVGTGLQTGAIGGLNKITTARNDAARAKAAEVNKGVFEALGEAAESSTLREKLPKKFQEFVQRVRENGPVSTVAIPVERFSEYFQSQDMDAVEMYEQLGGSVEAYREAEAAGTDLDIDIDQYATHIAGSEHHAGLIDDLRIGPDDMTSREAKEWNENREEIMKDLESSIGEAANQEGFQPIFDDVLGQLVAANMEESAAEQNATLMASVFTTLGERTGQDPMALYQKYGLRIQNDMPEILRSVGDVDTDIDPLLDRLRGGDIPTDDEVFGPSLTAFLKERGGLQDQGGELTARDVRREVRGLISKTGMTIDEAAEAAFEAGFIKAFDEATFMDALDRELAGDKVRRFEKSNPELLSLQSTLYELQRALEEDQIDLDQLTNQQVRELLRGETFEQLAPEQIEVDTSADGRQFVIRGERAGAEAARMEVEARGDDRLQIVNVEVMPGLRGEGIGRQMLEQAYALAEQQGKRLVSDTAVSVLQLRVYESLKRRGWTIEYAEPELVAERMDLADEAERAGKPIAAIGVGSTVGDQPVVTRIEAPISFNQSLTSGGQYLLDLGDGTSTDVREDALPELSQQPDLFAAPELSPKEREQESVANYKTLVKQEETARFSIGIDKVVDAEDAAHVLAPIRRNAQEVMMALVLDKDGKPLQVVHHAKGTIDGTNVYPSFLAGAVFATPGAASVWWAHNHPSGVERQSTADEKITEKLNNIFDKSSIEVKGHIVMGADGRATKLQPDGSFGRSIKVRPAARNKSVPVVERKLRGRPDKGDTISTPEKMRQLMSNVSDQDGIYLFNNRHVPVGFIAFTPKEMRMLKSTNALPRLLKGINDTNAAAMAIYTRESEDMVATNIGRFARAVDTRLLDHLEGPDYRSRATDNRLSAAGSMEFHQSRIGFTSGLLAAAKNLKQDKGTAEQMLNMLKKQPGVKQEELDWVGVPEFIAAKESVTKDELAAFIEANGVQVDEVQLLSPEAEAAEMSNIIRPLGYRVEGEYGNAIFYALDDDSKQLAYDELPANVQKVIDETFERHAQGGALAKYTEHVLPGGTNYREVLLTLPDARGDKFDKSKVEIRRDVRSVTQGSTAIYYDGELLANYGDDPKLQGDGTYSQESDEYWMQVAHRVFTSGDERNRIDSRAGTFRSGHFDQPNVLAHLRINDRTGPNGERILFIEEVQSDWHQKGRRSGYQSSLSAMDRQINQIGDIINETAHPAAQVEKIGVPDAPFKGNAWAELAIKRAIRMAAEGGYDQVAWTTGEQQADRYDLSKKVESITHSINGDGTINFHVVDIDGRDVVERMDAPQAEVESILGKDITDKILAREGKPLSDRSSQFFKDRGRGQTVVFKPDEPPRFDIAETEHQWVAVNSEGLELASVGKGAVDGKEEARDYLYRLQVSRNKDNNQGRWYIQWKNAAGEVTETGTYASAEDARKEMIRTNRDYIDNDAINDPMKLTGLDLKIGGEGMKSFYDRTLPNLFKKAARKLDKSITPTTTNIGKAADEEYMGPYTVEEWQDGRDDTEGMFAAVNREGGETGPFEDSDAAEAWIEEMEASAGGIGRVHAIDITQQVREKVLLGQTLFQEGGRRASITISEAARQVSINLTKASDLSSFLHESGHFYLEVLGDLAEAEGANEQITADYAALLKWFGVENRQGITRDHHEQFARGFEAYLFEGKAPSTALQNAFARFSGWLVAIYKKLTSLNVTLNDDIRSVFDRMVASDEAIAGVEESQNYIALFTSAKAAGMTPEQFEVYRDRVVQARMSAEQELTQKMLAVKTREQKKWWKAEREKVREAVAGEIHKMRAYRALAFLQRNETPDGTKLDGEHRKLAKSALVQMYGKDFLKRLPRPYVYSIDGGVHPDDVAAMFGYQSGDEMIQDIVNARNMRKLIEAETDARMREKHPDPMLDGTIIDEAMAAVHSEKRLRLLSAEMRTLRRLARADRPAVRASEKAAERESREAREANQGVLPSRDELKLLKAAAAQMIGQKKVRQITPHTFRAAAAKSARLAFEFAGKGDYQRAYFEKRRQVLNHELYRAAEKARVRIEKIVDYANTFNTPKKQQRMGKAGHLEQIQAILQRYSFSRISNIRSQKRVALALWVEEQREAGNEINIPDHILDESTKPSYKEITFLELEGIYDTLRNIDHLARLKNKLLASQDKRDFEVAVGDVLRSINANHKRKGEPVDYAKTWRTRLKTNMKHFVAEHTKMEFLFNWLDGEAEIGPVWQALFKPLADAESAEQAMQRDARAAMKKIFENSKRSDTATFWTRRIYVKEVDASFTKASILAVALNVGNEYNRDVLKSGHKWDEHQLNKVLSHLSEADWNMVQEIWNWVNSYWPAVSSLQKELTGVPPKKVEATPFIAPTGQRMAGGYYPIEYDAAFSERQLKQDEKLAVQEQYGGHFARIATRQGHTKERTNSGGKKIKLDLSVLSNHVTNVIHDLTHRRAIYDVRRLIEDKRIEDAIIETAGREMYRQLTPWLRNIAADFRAPMNRVEAILNHARAGTTVVNMGLKVTTMMVQPLGYLQTFDLLGEKYAALGLKKFYGDGKPWTHQKKQLEFAMERSEQLRNRMRTFDRDIRDQLKGVSQNRHNARRAWFYAIGLMDMGTSVPTWLGAYQKSMDGAVDGLDAGDETAAIDFADSVLRRSQAAGGAKDLAGIQSGHPLMKLFTLFYTYFNSLFNLMQRRIKKTDFRSPRDIARFTASMFYLWFIPAVLSEIVAGRGPDDDDEWDEWAAETFYIWGLYPLYSVVGVRDVVNALGPFGYEGSAAFAALKETSDSLIIPYKAIHPDEEVTRSDMKSAILAASYWGKLPGRQMWITGEYTYDWMTGEEQPEDVAEAIEGLAFSRRK